MTVHNNNNKVIIRIMRADCYCSMCAECKRKGDFRPNRREPKNAINAFCYVVMAMFNYILWHRM